jgi:hypothetical protein
MFNAAGVPGLYFDPIGYHPYAVGGMDSARRKNATRETTAPLKQWLTEHHKNPYPNKAEKIMLALITKMSLTQVSKFTMSTPTVTKVFHSIPCSIYFLMLCLDLRPVSP